MRDFCSIDVTSSYLAFRVIESINYFMVNSLTYCDIALFYTQKDIVKAFPANDSSMQFDILDED